MNKLKQLGIALALAAAAVLSVPAVAHAEVAPVKIQRFSWESSSGAGSVLNSPEFDTSKLEALQILVKNWAGGAARVLTITCLHANGTLVLYTFPTVSTADGASSYIVIDPRVGSGTAPTGATVWPVWPCAKMKFSVAAAGTEPVNVSIYGR